MKTETKTIEECETCWGTGYYHGHGVPCAEGCKAPAERVGLAVKTAPEVVEISGGSYKLAETQQMIDRTKRTFQNPHASTLKNEHVRVVMKRSVTPRGQTFERTKTGEIEGVEELNGRLMKIRLVNPLGLSLISAGRIAKIVRLSDSKTIWHASWS